MHQYQKICVFLVLISSSAFASHDFLLTTQYHRVRQVVESWLGHSGKPKSSAKNNSSSMHSLNTYPAKTALSKKALTLKLGMSKDDARALLGNPTWAETISGVQKRIRKTYADRSIDCVFASNH